MNIKTDLEKRMGKQYKIRRAMKVLRKMSANNVKGLSKDLTKIGAKKYDNDIYTVTYIAPKKYKGFSSPVLRKKYPAIYKQCLVNRKRRASIRIKHD